MYFQNAQASSTLSQIKQSPRVLDDVLEKVGKVTYFTEMKA